MANKLLQVDIALERILEKTQRLGSEKIALMDSLGRVLAETVVSNIDLPPFANSSMDGFAVRSADVRGADRTSPVSLSVTMDIPAGSSPHRELQAGEAARIMTGAPLPPGADAVIPVEDTDGNWDNGDRSPAHSVQFYRSVDSGAYVRPVGEDLRRGDVILEAGTLIRPQELGMLAALGYAYPQVIRRPRIAILSSGDELVGVEDALEPGKIRDVNSYTLSGLLRQYGAEPILLPIARDRLDAIRTQFNEAIALSPDMIISSAGASVGAADFVHTVLAELGQVDFWKINLRPGKPLAFGEIAGIPFFGLPGNPVSVMVTFDVLVRPAILKQAGRPDDWVEVSAVLKESLRSDGRRSYLRVKLQKDDNGVLYATTTGTQSSGALMSMVLADGLLIIPEDATDIAEGSSVQVRVMRRASLEN